MKFLLGLITAILITGVASAQHGNSPAGHVSLGIKGGVNIFNVHNDNDINYDKILGYNIGLLGHIHINSQWAVQPEILYSAQGWKIGDTKHHLDYINVPVLLQYMFDNGFRLHVGPQIGFLVNSTDNRDNFNAIAFGASIGASYVVPSTGFGIDARYNLGLSNINKTSTVNSTNRGVQVGLFYIFGHNAKETIKNL